MNTFISPPGPEDQDASWHEPRLSHAQRLAAALLPWYRPQAGELTDGPCVITTEKEAEAC
jgi:hypothetical protein